MLGKLKSSTINLLVNLSILAAFLLTFKVCLTGVPLHEWLGLALGGWIEDRRRTRKAIRLWRPCYSLACTFRPG